MISGDQLQQLKAKMNCSEYSWRTSMRWSRFGKRNWLSLRRKADGGRQSSEQTGKQPAEMGYSSAGIGLTAAKAYGSSNREAALETEILESIRMEKEYWRHPRPVRQRQAEITLNCSRKRWETKRIKPGHLPNWKPVLPNWESPARPGGKCKTRFLQEELLVAGLGRKTAPGTENTDHKMAGCRIK